MNKYSLLAIFVLSLPMFAQNVVMLKDGQQVVQAVSVDGEVVACLMACDQARKEWRMEAFYD